MEFKNGPYIGPKYFTRAEHDLFFGREREIVELASLVTAYTDVLVYANSAAGKSSLLHAGLIPALEQQGHEVFYPPARVGGDLERNGAVDNVFIANALAGWFEKDEEPPVKIRLAEYLRSQRYSCDGLRIIVFDQFEEIFTQDPGLAGDREDFFRQVGSALEEDMRLRCVFVMRQESIAELDRYAPLLPGKLRTRFHLERLRREDTLLAVTEPLKRWHVLYGEGPRAFADDLADEVVGDLLEDEEFAEPFDLQVYCKRIWEKWLDSPQEDSTIGPEQLRAAGSVKEAREQFFDAEIKNVAVKTGVPERELNRWFADNLITTSGKQRSQVARDDETETTEGLANSVVDVLEEHRLISSVYRNKGTWYELVHDRFIEHVQALREQEAKHEQEERLREQERRKARRLRLAALAFVVVVVMLILVGYMLYMSPLMAPSFFDSGNFNATEERYQAAIDDYNNAINRRPDWAQAYYERALVYWEANQSDEALASLSRALELGLDEAGSTDAYVLQGRIYLELSQYKPAETAFSQAIVSDADCVAAYVGLGTLAYRQGENEQAITWLRDALLRNAGYADAYRILGDVYAATLDTVAAHACYQEYVGLTGAEATPYVLDWLAKEVVPLSDRGECVRGRQANTN